MNNLPEFESLFLTEVTKSFSKVRKSLKYDSHDLQYNKVIDSVSDKQLEKIELLIQSSASRNNIRIRLYAWDDRWLWIDARKSKKEGWEWEYTVEGRLSGSVTERELIEALKSFNKGSPTYTTGTITKTANLHWKKLIATGPKEVVTNKRGRS